jgi:hypothetical protein
MIYKGAKEIIQSEMATSVNHPTPMNARPSDLEKIDAKKIAEGRKRYRSCVRPRPEPAHAIMGGLSQQKFLVGRRGSGDPGMF